MNREDEIIYTVCGPIAAATLGLTLPHEHIMVDFGGAATAGKHRYDADEVITVMQPYLEDVCDQGFQSFFECTPNYLGRDVAIFRTLSEQTGLNIISNTGLYNNQYLPDYAHSASAEELANDWIAEFENGIEDTGIKPGFIKTAVNPQPNDLDLKLIQAAALTHKATGLTIATHTCTAEAAEAIVAVLEANGVDLQRWIFVHAHLEDDIDRLLALAKDGVWIELDGLAWGGDEEHANKLLRLLDGGYEDQVLISQDAGWYHIGEEGGGEIIPFTRLKDAFLPRLKAAGVDERIIDKITVQNPSQAFACRS